ncbi:carbon-monoxide dehydrogenase small subunit [Caloramator quimbayensis]|uniref:Carbon-monoxide dehydrogenase small subunit n=1 Tax=Caloramator quimbayensis TaxID=1147123 RepID=A0A1T4Y8W2_9CLOT|nr:(2Fe-2S)-binding protein [Caloramator quimbayensis]SKA97715.1 carbon-monoxide dehydrogenase small subunit [Caloramator quimbayensis]
MENKIKFILNGEEVEVLCSPVKRLLDVLRDDFNLSGAKEGCGKGECGACSVLIDGKLINSCLYPAQMAEGKEVLTIEGLKKSRIFEILSESFIDAGAVQCGFCTPGMIMASYALLRKNPNPTEEDIREGLSGNLCRCTGYNMIIEAVKMAAKRGEGLW